MKSALWILALLTQLAFACLVFIWILAFLGFADESKRSVSATLFGKFLVVVCVLLAASPIGITLWVGWCHYFSPAFYKQIPLGLFLPLVAILSVMLLCSGLIYVFKLIGYRKGR